jgi:hypothetical protein
MNRYIKTDALLLNRIATFIWVVGSVALIRKGFILLMEADLLNPDSHLPGLSVLTGFWIGIAKGKYIFARSWLKNRDRIVKLKEPKIWQFFSNGFFIALSVMITAGVTLSAYSHGSFGMLIAVGILDLTIGFGLISGRFFFIHLTESAVT